MGDTSAGGAKANSRLIAGELRPGMLVRRDERVYRVLNAVTGEDGTVRVKLRALDADRSRETRFERTEAIELACAKRDRVRFDGANGGAFLFTNIATGAEVRVAANEICPTAEFLVEGMTVFMASVDGRFAALDFPEFVEIEVADTQGPLHDEDAPEKPATLKNGFRVMVPAHVMKGEKIVVHFPTLRYVDPARATHVHPHAPATAGKER